MLIFAKMTNYKKIIVSVTNDLCTDQRVHKVCCSLQQNGYQVLLVGRRLSNSPKLGSRAYETKRFKLLFENGPLFYLSYTLRLFWFLSFQKFHAVLSNDLDTLLANYWVSKLKSKKLVYDSHEYFTEVPELINRPKIQKIWLKIESTILPNLKNCYTVSQKIADEYNSKYRINMEVVRNFPISKYSLPTSNKEKENLILYQGALNVGRGLEELILSMQFISNAKLLIAGSGDIEYELHELTSKIGVSDKVEFLGRLSLLELFQVTRRAKLGVSLEKDLGLNYRYAVPNKIFDYIHANVPVLYSPLVEVVDLLSSYLVGETLINHEPRSIAQQINNMLISEMRSLWESECKRAAEEFNWEKEEKKLLQIVNRVE